MSSKLFAEWNEERGKKEKKRWNEQKPGGNKSYLMQNKFYSDDDIDDDEEDTMDEMGEIMESKKEHETMEETYEERNKGNFQCNEFTLLHQLLTKRSSKSNRHRKPYGISSIQTSNKVMIIGTKQGTLLRILLAKLENKIAVKPNEEETNEDMDDIIEEILIEPHVPITKVFIDPSSHHILLSLENNNSFYLHMNSTRPRKIVRLQNQMITAVGWNEELTCLERTDTIAIGTFSGALYEAIFEDGKEKLCRQVYSLANQGQILGAEMTTWKDSNNAPNYYILLLLSNQNRRFLRFFQFIGGPTLEFLFAQYNNVDKLRFQDLPGYSSSCHSINCMLQCRKSTPRPEDDRTTIRREFSILTGKGIYCGEIALAEKTTSLDGIISNTNMVAYDFNEEVDNSETDRGKNVGANRGISPIMHLATAFHIFLVYPTQIMLINKISQCVVFSQQLSDEKTNLRSQNANKDTINLLGACLFIHSPCCRMYAFTESKIYRFQISDEKANIWKLYVNRVLHHINVLNDEAILPTSKNAENIKLLIKRDFRLALSLCPDTNARKQVYRTQGDYYFNYLKALKKGAFFYAKSDRSLEEIAYQLLSLGRTDALIFFLNEKLRVLLPGDKTQKTLLCTWILELYLKSIQILPETPTNQSPEGVKSGEKERLQSELRQFIEENVAALDPLTSFQLLHNFNAEKEFIYYARLIDDYNRIISTYLQRKQGLNAIEFISHLSPSIPQLKELIYSFSSQLMLYSPKDVIEMWKKHNEVVDVRNLIPAMTVYYRHLVQKNKKEEGGEEKKKKASSLKPKRRNVTSTFSRDLDILVSYLFFVMKNGNDDRLVHNFLILLLGQHPDERQMVRFLRAKISEAQRSSSNKDNERFIASFHFDIHYAIRICLHTNKPRSLVYLYYICGLYEESIAKALQVDIKLAKEIANYCSDKRTDEEDSSDTLENTSKDLKRNNDDERCKKSWLLIAKHMIDTGTDIKECINIIKESKNLVRIEDLLAYIPDYTLIDEFKKEITENMENYNNQIKSLKNEMNDYIQSTEAIRHHMQKIRQRRIELSGNQCCDLTGEKLLSKEFYVFPCGHAFHAEALEQEVHKYLNTFQKERLKQLKLKKEELMSNMKEKGKKVENEKMNMNFAFHFKRNKTGEMKDMTELKKELSQIQEEMDDMIGSECIFCGEVMIRSIHIPLAPEDDDSGEWII